MSPDASLIPAIRDRRSLRAMDARPIPPEALASIFEAARWAPSAFNQQPWRYLVFDARNPEARAKAEATLTAGNAWAKRAPVLVLSVVQETRNDVVNRTAWHDVGLANQSLLLQATALGIIAHPMAGFDVEQARTSFAIPTGYAPVAMIALGYPGDVSLLDDRQRQRETEPRVRHEASQFVFVGGWERTG